MTGSLQIKNDNYYAVLNFRDQSGARKQKWINLNMPVKGNKRRAEIRLNELLMEYQGIESITPLNTLLSTHIAAWIESNRPNIAVTTYNQYVNMLNLHIAPYFDARGITLSAVTAGDLEDYYTSKVAEGLNPNTVIKHHAIIRSALQWAVKHRYIRDNVADLANRPSRSKYQGAEPYSIEEVAQLLTLTQNEPIAVPIFLASFYGLRRSELLGLRWSAIDFQNGWLHISTTVVKEKEGDRIHTVVRENTTKTEYSNRSLPLCHYTYQYLLNVQYRQRSQWHLCGGSYDTRYIDFVCVDNMGTLLQPDYVSQKFQKVLEHYHLRKIRFHDLRHSNTSLLIAGGTDVTTVAGLLGHSQPSTTLDIYSHAFDKNKKTASQALQKGLEI